MAVLHSFLLPWLALACLAFAQDPSSAIKGSTFIYQGKGEEFGPPQHQQTSDPRIVFALNAESSTGDLYFHLESPKDNQWVGVGIGSQMKDALFLIAYASDNATGVTISGRTASGHTEPSPNKDIVIEKLYDQGLADANTVTGGGARDDDEGSIMADGVCRKCADHGDGVAKIDFNDEKQPFIFAIGPPLRLETDSIDGDLQTHILYGQFTLNMKDATSSDSASVPQGPYAMSSSASLVNAKEYNDPGSRIHGAVMSLVFIILLPLGALLLRVWNVRAHIIVQLIGWILFCMAFAGGIVASKKYNKSKAFASGHQVIGILLFIALLSQWVLGWMNHQNFKKLGHGSVLGKIHLYLGPAILFLGWINGAVGFRFAGQPFLALPYGILIIIVIILYTLIRILIARRQQRAKAGQAPPGMPAFGNGGVPLGQQQGYAPSDPPPAYGQGIHLQQYPSSNSLPQTQAPPQARPMV